MEETKINPPEPEDPSNLIDQFKAYMEVVRLLRKHCPWDREQTNESIAYLLIEETYEMIDSIEKKDDREFAKELGDVLLHVVMHSIMAEERGAFSITDVLNNSRHKLVSRHPHVFGQVNVSGEKEVTQNWEAIKMKEGRESVLEGVPSALPALLRAQRIQYKASRIGFDWDNKEDVWAKVEEELRELKEEILAGNNEKANAEIGDVLFAIVNAARFQDVMAEEALQKTNNKFISRFRHVEARAAEMNKKLKDMTLGEMDELWEEAKKIERENK